MKPLRLLLLLVLVFASFCSVTTCRAETAEEMLSACRPITLAPVSNGSVDLPTTFESGSCWGAFGMLQTVVRLVGENKHHELHACLPADTTRTQLIAIFVKYIEKHPEEYGKQFSLVALNSIIDLFPCTDEKK